MFDKILYIVAGVIALIVVGGGGFYAGMTYAQSQPQAANTNFIRQRAANQSNNQNGTTDPCGFPSGARQFGQNANGGTPAPTGSSGTPGANPQGGRQGFFGGAFGNFDAQQLGECLARGQIKSVNGNTVEISTANQVVTIQVSDQTVISKTDRGSVADLQPGDRVTVFAPQSGDKNKAGFIQLQRAQGQQ